MPLSRVVAAMAGCIGGSFGLARWMRFGSIDQIEVSLPQNAHGTAKPLPCSLFTLPVKARQSPAVLTTRPQFSPE
jgi:hypothetical protein